MNVPRHRQQAISASLAILAMLLLMIAPVVSKSLMHQQMIMAGSMASSVSHNAHPMAMMPDMDDMEETDSVDNSMAGHHVHDHQSAAENTPAADNHLMDRDDDAACGYCTLLIHVPFMVWALLVLSWLMLMTRTPRPPLRLVRPVSPSYSLSQPPRGPPAAHFSV
ncbi:hypothetical protein BTJ39_03715 [Izhakiella australiensis]|uniref:DUF2946 domain-containing protein n=1 Tax=Izhakiella australiensis TaxID=1926881 RepID=A0A1S8YQB0_9GAMM|nr:DUF2946 domain-containing protein [Izhakiella australiensis]OON41088.1 hypothetical protein BTJ39_03715 [Izhakiella australiensis]